MISDMQRSISFGLKTSQQGFAYDEIVALWREADRMPIFEHAWLWDHMLPLRGDVRQATLEAWTLLAALATQTSRLCLGVIVTSNRLRPPTLLAKMAATVDQISGGRLVLGIGAGGSRVADPAGMELVQREFDAYGIEIVATAEAVAALGEACTIIRRMWTATQAFDFAGRHYRLRGTVCEPKPIQQPHPPILIGAGGEKIALRIVAEHANIWNCPARNAEEFRHKSRVLDDHCRAIGRNPEEIVRSMQVIVSADDVPGVRRLLLELIEAGCRHLVLGPRRPVPSAAWLAEEIIEPVLAEASAVL
jgi:alkanesulfonate monooxygenase SsuD/methylene tetrahydromethanopterin reductase-like flavin-dependent oxidoreductase (luciferase family)